MDSYRFEHIDYLWGLSIVPLLWLISLIYWTWRNKRLKEFVGKPLLTSIIPDISNRKFWIKLLLYSMGIISLVIALANPQLGSRLEEVERKGVDIMICLDISNSMLAEDLTPNRLERSKRAITKILKKLHGDRIGMVVFAGDAFVQLPITTDYSAANLFVKSVSTKSIENQGTAIGDAIELAIKSFNQHRETGKVIIVLSDGEDHEGSAFSTAAHAESLGIKVHTIGIGSPKGSPIPIYRNGKQVGFRKDKTGSTIVTKINEEMLLSIAEAGGGKYIRATNADAGLEELIEDMNEMEQGAIDTKIFADYEDRFQSFLAIGLLFFILEGILATRKSHWLRRNKLFGTEE